MVYCHCVALVMESAVADLLSLGVGTVASWRDRRQPMSESHSSIVDRGLDVLDGIHALIDVAFAHDLAVSFADRGTHDAATSIADAMVELLVAVHDELLLVDSLGQLGALLGMVEPFWDATQELLLGAAHPMGPRPVFAVLHLERPLSLAFAHLRAAGRLGARERITAAQRRSLRAATEALLINLDSFQQLLRALDPIEAALAFEPAVALAPE